MILECRITVCYYTCSILCITHAELSPDVSVKDEVLESEPGDMEDDEEGEGGDAASLGSTSKLLESRRK